jgi:hypothetical protein
MGPCETTWDTHHCFAMLKKLVAYKWFWQQWQRLLVYIETLESGVLLTTQGKKQEIKNIYLDNTVVPAALIILFSEILKFSKNELFWRNIKEFDGIFGNISFIGI